MKKTIICFSLLAAAMLFAAACSPAAKEERPVQISAGNIKVTATDAKGGAEAVRAIIERERPVVDSVRRPLLGHAAKTHDKFRPESPLMNFAADALLHMARKKCPAENVDAAVTNIGGLRDIIRQGDVTFGSVYDVFPFENTLALVTLDGGQMLRLCREIAAVGGEAVSGLRLVISADKRLLSATVNGSPIDPARKYVIATSDYLSEGKDKLFVLKQGHAVKYESMVIRDLMVEYITSLEAEGKKLDSICDGRIAVEGR